MLLDPMQSSYLIHETIIGHSGFEMRYNIGIEKTKYTKTVINGDHDLLRIAG